MRTTLNIEDDLLQELKRTATRRGIPLKKLVNSALRQGLQGSQRRPRRRPYRCPVFAMGQPAVNLDKALTIADRLEDEEVVRELERRQ